MSWEESRKGRLGLAKVVGRGCGIPGYSIVYYVTGEIIVSIRLKKLVELFRNTATATFIKFSIKPCLHYVQEIGILTRKASLCAYWQGAGTVTVPGQL